MIVIDKVLEQIKKDVGMGDMTAIEELLSEVSEKILQGFLSEEKPEEKPDYNHMFDIAFSVTSQKEDPYKVLPSELRAALITRIADIDVEKGWEEAVGFCDRYEMVKKT